MDGQVEEQVVSVSQEVQEKVKKRKRSRTYGEWKNLYTNLRKDSSKYEREFLRYALRLTDEFPQPECEVRRVIEQAHVTEPSISSVPVPLVPNGVKNLDISLSQLFKESETERSLSYLKNLQPPANYNPRPTLDQLRESFKKNSYFVSEDDLFTIHQAISHGRPVKVDGPPGVGKTELAKQIAIAMGLDVTNSLHFGELFVTPDISKEEAFYRWNDALRLVDTQLVTSMSGRMNGEELKKAYTGISENTYSTRYLDIQVLVRSCVIPYSTVCLVDEIDKAYHEFDNYLLGVVDNNYFSVPEFGRVGRAKHDRATAPIFVITSNQTRALSGPLVRRCKAVFYDYLDETLESRVIHAKTGMNILDSGKLAAFFKKIRKHEKLRLQQPPSTAEVIETANALRDSAMEVTEQNVFKMHGHWIKYRVDYIAVSHQFLGHDGKWAESVV